MWPLSLLSLDFEFRHCDDGIIHFSVCHIWLFMSIECTGKGGGAARRTEMKTLANDFYKMLHGLICKQLFKI